jgi:hypothetical protein
MIADLDRSIEKLLVAEFPIKNGEIDIKFDQPAREWSSRLSRPTLNFFLFDIRENNVLRQHQWERMLGENGRNLNNVAQKRTPFRLDCHYMLTSWAAEPQDEHRLLSRAMLALFRYPFIPDTHCFGSMQEQPFKVQARLASHDKLTNPAELWGSLDNEIRPSLSYIVTIALDPWATVTGPAVRTLTWTLGQAEELPTHRILMPQTAEQRTVIGGHIHQNQQPQDGLQVAIKGTGHFTTTNPDGEFILDGLSPGEHTLVVWLPNGQIQEKIIHIPAESYDIEL